MGACRHMLCPGPPTGGRCRWWGSFLRYRRSRHRCHSSCPHRSMPAERSPQHRISVQTWRTLYTPGQVGEVPSIVYLYKRDTHFTHQARWKKSPASYICTYVTHTLHTRPGGRSPQHRISVHTWHTLYTPRLVEGVLSTVYVYIRDTHFTHHARWEESSASYICTYLTHTLHTMPGGRSPPFHICT